jgi:hypothetical protein
MTSRPILFSAPMVRALLNGSKTQTRRICKLDVRAGMPEPEVASLLKCCPYGQPGDELWVRETLDHDAARGHFYKATGMYVGPLLDYEREPPPAIGLPTRAIPSIHMPRWASRITLRITDVRVERLQDISEADVIAEGVPRWPLGYRVEVSGAPKHESRSFDRSEQAYRWLWESINGQGSWDANPWVWVVEFRRLPTNQRESA